tara:strand:- start:202 stop:1560 length:1359 start_codon:yes stop_codon:yes gene_type:complete
MKNIHFIAIGGSAMHNLAIELYKKGYNVTGSDDSIFEPSKSRLIRYGLLPNELGWFKEKISNKVEGVILGMHAKKDNIELLEAQRKNVPIFSYPEFLFNHSKLKTRVVISGSHGKTSITSMILHVLNFNNISVDYMLGAQLDGFETMVHLTEENDFILIEGDEYLSSAIDLKSKFLWYKPNITLISGIYWDHVNVFPTVELYEKQFRDYIESIVPGGVLVFNESDQTLKRIVKDSKNTIRRESYDIPEHCIINGKTFLKTNYGEVPLKIFGKHNLENLSGAKWICQLMGIDSVNFYDAISTFNGASKRLELIHNGINSFLYKDFAHSPSKVKASSIAIHEQFPELKKVFCLELHTYSSLDPDFIKRYSGSLDLADESIIFYNPNAQKFKERLPLTIENIKDAFSNSSIIIFTNQEDLSKHLCDKKWDNSVLLMMSSGNYCGIDWDVLKSNFK